MCVRVKLQALSGGGGDVDDVYFSACRCFVALCLDYYYYTVDEAARRLGGGAGQVLPLAGCTPEKMEACCWCMVLGSLVVRRRIEKEMEENCAA